MRAFDTASSLSWAILPESLQTILDIAARVDGGQDAERIAAAMEKRAERDSGPSAVATRRGDRVEGSHRTFVRSDAPGVAIIPVTGPIFRYANLFTYFSGGTSTELLAQDIKRSLDNPGIQSILLSVDSPGGEAHGINELANIIREGSGKKPIVAYVSGMGASGAYWLASAADEIVVDDLANLGSIGVVMTVPDSKAELAKRNVYQFVSSQSPHKRPALGTDSGNEKIQKIVDDMAGVFISAVAMNRGVSEKKVINDFGGGGILVGKAAVKAGLADRSGSFESVLMEMAGGKRERKRKMAAAASDNTQPEAGANGGQSMSLWEQVKAALSGETHASTDEQQERRATVPNSPSIPLPPPAPAAIEPSQPAAAATQPPATGRSDDEMARLRADVERERNARIASEAAAFAQGEVTARRALPAERTIIATLYTQAALDDAAHPAQVGFMVGEERRQGSRVDAIKAAFAARPAHNLTRELVAFDASTMQQLPKGDEQAGMVKAAAEGAKAYAESANKGK